MLESFEYEWLLIRLRSEVEAAHRKVANAKKHYDRQCAKAHHLGLHTSDGVHVLLTAAIRYSHDLRVYLVYVDALLTFVQVADDGD